MIQGYGIIQIQGWQGLLMMNRRDGDNPSLSLYAHAFRHGAPPTPFAMLAFPFALVASQALRPALPGVCSVKQCGCQALQCRVLCGSMCIKCMVLSPSAA